MKLCFRLSFISLVVSGAALTLAACASDQKRAPTAEDVREGEALPPAPPVPAEPASTNSPTAPTVPDSAVPRANSGATAPSAAPAGEAAPAREALSEPQLAKIAELANSSEVDQGKIAQRKAKAANVKKFADMMVKHHGDAKAEQAKLFKKLNLVPADSAAATALKSDADQTLETLNKAAANDFDAAYVKSQIDGHQKVLDLLDVQLLPTAKTPELADSLRKMRATVEQHLNEAKSLQASK